MKRSKKSPTAGRVSQKTGLPKVDPDAVEQNHVLDNMVPTQGFDELPMVGLGGSAGAISALRTFLQNVPVDSGMVFVVILHLSPEFDSSLANVLQLSTTMVVKQAEDGEKVQRNCVYVIPPGKHLTSLDGTLRLTDLEPERGKRVAVDLFFRSLADSHGAHAMAIVLSGAAGDGAIGIKRIKERGGLTIAQDPDEAEHRGMPQSAIATGMVDWVLRVAEMPARLLEYRANEARVQVPPEEGQEPTKAPKDTADQGEIALREVLDFLRARTGADFSCYKRATIVRRVSRRMQVNSLINLSAYHAFLRTHPGEAGALLQDLLISVTNFFRDREAFEALELLIPNLFQDKGPSDQVRIWVPACATGEEAYSIAMLLLEHARKLDSPPSLQVFACDLDEAAIVQARAALYPEAISADVSEERLLRFFTHDTRGYRIRREVREMVLFAAHDLLKDAPFSRMDLISCRNLLIYLNREAQSRALDIFHFALRPSGLLFLGSSEAIDETSALFRVSDKKHRIFTQQPARRLGLPVPLGPGLLMRAMQVQEDSRHAPVLIGRSFGLTHLPPADAEPGTGNDHLSSSELHLRLAERIAPPSVIVNADYDIVHLSPSAGRFLQLTGGDPTLNLLRVVHPMMRVELRAALFHASESGETIEVPRVSFEFEGNHREVTLRVAPARELAPGFSIVAFDLIEMAAENAIPAARTRSGESDPMRPLELENESLKSRLRDTVEQYEASNEEQKASNEELQSMNEELRSTAEELETSREELQSVNEELSTVNGELKSRVEDLNHANSDLQNLMAASAIATLFLDRDLRIMRYTPSAVSLFSLIPGDIGRPLADLRHQIEYADLSADARRVLEFLSPVERQVQSAGEWYLTRLLPYRTLDDHIAGVVLTFVNITAAKDAEDKLRESEEQFRRALEDAPIPVIMQADDGQVLQISNTWTELTGYSREEIPTFDAWLNHAYGSGTDIVRDHVRELFDGKLRQIELEIEVKTRSGEKRHWAFSASAPGRLRDGRRFIVGMALDITERAAASAALSESQERLRMVVENAREYAIFSLDPQRNITTWNSGAEAILGWSENEILGQSADIIFTAEDRANDVAGQEMQTALKKGRAEDERWHLRKDGSRFWASGVMMPMRDMQNQITGFVKIFRDQTQSRFDEEARREAEERFRILVDSVQDYAIFLLDAEGFITSWNQGAARIKGYTEEEVIGQHVSLFYTTDEITDNLPQKEMATARAHGRSENESWRVRKDGSLFWVNEIMISLSDSSGGFAKISRDLTERKKFEDELTKHLAAAQSARQDAEAAGKAKDHFIAVLSHELRTPLTPVFLAVQALRHTKNLPPFAVESIEMIDRNVKLEARMIDDLLDLTRMAHGKIELLQDEVDLHRAIHDALQVAQGDIQGRRQKLSVELEATQFLVCGDFQRLQQVFWNLLKNASKFAPFDGSIGVKSRNEDHHIVVSITDNGIGIAPDALARIFEAFTQADDTINRHFGGLGLGLSIASATISGLGGTLSADSAGQGHGAVFTVRLPLLSPASS